jgi:hypothetical protein
MRIASVDSIETPMLKVVPGIYFYYFSEFKVFAH